MTGHHVIILGAGASKSSGYPLGNDLRLMMQSPDHLRKLINEAGVAYSQFQEFIESHKTEMDVLRHGGFGSVDEYCRIAGAHDAKRIRKMKHLVAFCLAITDPESHFIDSSYYPFLQRLFVDDSPELRADITVLSFNYDPYLEFLIHRACERRLSAHAPRQELNSDLLNSIHSGMWDTSKVTWADGDRFRLLKLHGTIVPPVSLDGVGVRELISQRSMHDRLKMITKLDGFDDRISFPWEISKTTNQAQQNAWDVAKRMVAKARRISFVGLSMHSYLNEGFQRLFEKVSDDFSCQLVVCDHSNKTWNKKQRFGLNSSSGRVLGFFRRMKDRPMALPLRPAFSMHNASDFSDDGDFHDHTLRIEFSSFIERDMHRID